MPKTIKTDSWKVSLAKKYKLTVNKIEQDYQNIMAREDVTDEKVARAILRRQYRRHAISPAELFEGVILGATRPFNMSAPKITAARNLFTNNPQEAIRSKITDREGNPIEIINGNEKRIPEKNYIRSFIGVASRAKTSEDIDDTIKPIILTISGSKADPTSEQFLEPVLGVPVRFKANISRNNRDATKYLLNGSTLTSFDTWEEALPDPVTLIETFLREYVFSLGSIRQYIQTNRTMKPLLGITKASILDFYLLPNRNGNKRVNLDDESLWSDSNNEDQDPISAWVPEFVNLDGIQPDREVYVIGQPNISTNPNFPGANINVCGLYFIGETTVPSPEIVSEDDLGPLDFEGNEANEFGDDE